MLASTGLTGWVLVIMPQNLGWCWLAALLIYPTVACIAWPMATFLAYIGARFRDLPHALGLVFQTIWFISPIYFEPKLFRNGNLEGLVDYNPVYHLLEIIRAPLLRGVWPTAENYLYCMGLVAGLTLIACLAGLSAEERVITYL
jgi:lipopolysaccharide transport system permease protein